MPVLSIRALEELLAEDVPHGDLTTDALGIGHVPGQVRFSARAAMTVAAIEEAGALFSLAGADVTPQVRTGEIVQAGATLLSGTGRAADLLRAWKVAQTLIETWSGVATATTRLVVAARAVKPEIVVACTRKNIPGTKALAVAAVKAGGAVMHRLGLSETVLIFPEHRVFCQGDDLRRLALNLKARLPEKKLVIEVSSASDGLAAAKAGFDVIQTEKFSADAVAQLATEIAAMTPRPVVAAAGGINPDNAGDYARAGADILVTSWPYTARPADVAVAITR